MTDLTEVAKRLAQKLREEKPPIEERNYKVRYQQWEQDCIAVGSALSILESGNVYYLVVNEFIHACGSTKTL